MAEVVTRQDGRRLMAWVPLRVSVPVECDLVENDREELHVVFGPFDDERVAGAFLKLVLDELTEEVDS